jgi:hypothetical protein
MTSPHPVFLLLDRTAVLFCGVAAGIAIGIAYAPMIGSWLGDAPLAGLAGRATDAPPARPGQPVALPAAVAPAARVPAGLARAVEQRRPFRIGVLGDSFGDGLWTALYNQLPRREAFQVLRFSEQATGFTRYRQTNLETRLADQLAQGPIDVAIISFGANDVQGIYADGRVAPFLSPRWQAEVGARITRYVKALQAQGAAVFWVGLPIMRDAGFDAQVRDLNGFHAGLMAKLGVPFIDTRSAALGADGRYAAFLPDPQTGLPSQARAGDGIHMSMKGYRLLTAALAERLRAWGRAARRGEPVPAALVPPPVVAPAVVAPAEDAPETAAAPPADAASDPADAALATPTTPPAEPPVAAPTQLLPELPPATPPPAAPPATPPTAPQP